MVSDAHVTPYSDELYYSLLARANARWRFPSRRTIGELAYQKNFVASSLELPGHLEDGLAFLLPSPLYSVDQVIDNHTLLPLFSPFLPVERTRQLRADMRGSQGASIYVRSGLKASSVPSPDCLRYCQRCADEDRQRVGETYWRRIHQVVGVELCPEHGGALQNAHARISRLHTAYEYIAAEDVTSHQPDTDHCVSGDATDQILRHPVFTFVAQNAAWLLRQESLGVGLATLRYRYHDVLTKRDLTIRGGNIRMQEVVAIFMDRIPPEEQSRLHCDLILQSTDHWLARLLRAPRVAQHPLHHLLVMYMLNITARDFFEPLLSAALDTTLPMKLSGGVLAPFGAPPWPCLNPASDHYRELRIAQYEDAAFHYPEGRALPPPRARFACDCGFVYLRTGPDQTQEDHFRYDQVERYGWVWEQRLAQLWSDQAMSLRSIAKSLQVSTRTVKRYVALAGLLDRLAKHAAADVQQRHDQAPTTSSEASALLIARTRVAEGKPATPGATVRQVESRKVWLDAIAIQPGVGVKGLRRQFPAIYAWLYRHDRDWLRAHSPLRQIANPQCNRRVNWETRDEQCALAVQEAAQRLLRRDGKPVRLSKSALIRETEQSSMIFEKIDKLPRTAAILILMSESREAFAVRRIQITATQFLREQVIPRQWQLVRRAGVERLIHVDSVVRALAEAFAVMRHPVVPLDLT